MFVFGFHVQFAMVYRNISKFLADLTGWIGFNVLSRYEGSSVDYRVIQGVRSQSSDRLCPTNVNTYLFTYVVYANRNRIVALATIEPVDHEAFRGSQDLKLLPCLSRIF